MTIVAVAGDACTTTTLALAAAWPSAGELVVIEADPSGGDMSAWLDLTEAPSLSTLVTRMEDGTWAEIDRHARTTASGLRVIPAPATLIEARQSVAESARIVGPTLARRRHPTVLVDTGRLQMRGGHPLVDVAALTLVVHRQSPQSSAAAAVRLQRLAEQIELTVPSGSAVIVAVVGSSPFDIGQVHSFLADSIGETLVAELPVDPLAAAVLAGRAGVSPRRMARLPLSRATRDLADHVMLALERDPVSSSSGGR